LINSERDDLQSAYIKPAMGEALQAAAQSGSKTKQETAKVPEVFFI
jgi:hypothetical protein